MSDHRPSEKPVAIGERRIHARTPVTPQAFVKFGDNNYGFVFNISETGLVFAPTGALTLAIGASAKLRFQLPDSKEWIQANGEIVWIAQSPLPSPTWPRSSPSIFETSARPEICAYF